MRLKLILITIAVSAVCFSCTRKTTTQGGGNQSGQPRNENAAELPSDGFKAQLTLVDPPDKLRAGEKRTVQVKIRNASTVFWWARGGRINNRSDNKFYIAAADRWLKSDGSLLTDMDGRYGIGKDLSPQQETEVPLLITAPNTAGNYTLEIDLVQEGVAWFSDKGSPTTRAKITVVK